MKIIKNLGWIISTLILVPLVVIIIYKVVRTFVPLTPWCNSSQTVEYPLVESLMDYIEKYGVPGNLMEVKNLPYALDCAKYTLSIAGTNKYKKFNQVCNFIYDNEKYKFEFGYNGAQTKNISFKVNNIEVVTPKRIREYIVSYDSRKNELLRKTLRQVYDNPSTGLCATYYPLGRIWGN